MRKSVQDEATKEKSLRDRLAVDDQIFREAVLGLFVEAMSESPKADAAASVLLSVYQETDFCIQLADLKGLGVGLFDSALLILRGMVINHHEPHLFLEYGDQKFKTLLSSKTHLAGNQRFFG